MLLNLNYWHAWTSCCVEGQIWIVLMASLLTCWTGWWLSEQKIMVLLRWYRWGNCCVILLSNTNLMATDGLLLFWSDFSTSRAGWGTALRWRESSLPWRDWTTLVLEVLIKFINLREVQISKPPSQAYALTGTLSLSLSLSLSSGMQFSYYHLPALWRKWMVEKRYAR